MSFRDWLVSLRATSSRVSRVVAGARTSFPLEAERRGTARTHGPFAHSPADARPGFPHLSAAVDDAAVNWRAQTRNVVLMVANKL